MASPTSGRGLAKDKLKTSCISVKQIIDNDDDEAHPPPFHDEKEEEEEKEEDTGRHWRREDDNDNDNNDDNNGDDDDDDDDDHELARVLNWHLEGHEYKLPMKKISVCSSSQQSRLVVITINVFNLSIVKKTWTNLGLAEIRNLDLYDDWTQMNGEKATDRLLYTLVECTMAKKSKLVWNY